MCRSFWTGPRRRLRGSHSLQRRCFRDVGLIGLVESPRCCCSSGKAQDQIKQEAWLAVRMGHSIFKQHLCPSEQSQKTCSAWILVSLCGGVSLLYSLCLCAASLIPDFFVCAALPSFLSNKFSLASYFIWPFFSFSLSRRIYINTACSILPFVPSSHSHSPVSLSLPPHPLPWFSRV